MMRSAVTVILTISSAALALQVADTSARTLTSIKAGERCSFRSAPAGVFVGRFSGYEELKFNFTDIGRNFTTQRCFTTAVDCDNWLYTMQSKYSAGASQAHCRYKG